METLSKFNELARRAFNWTSFDPEKRGESTIKGHEKLLNEDLQTIAGASDEVKAQYVERFKSKFASWLSAHSR